jgi:hypothetical protein
MRSIILALPVLAAFVQLRGELTVDEEWITNGTSVTAELFFNHANPLQTALDPLLTVPTGG